MSAKFTTVGVEVAETVWSEVWAFTRAREGNAEVGGRNQGEEVQVTKLMALPITLLMTSHLCPAKRHSLMKFS